MKKVALGILLCGLVCVGAMLGMALSQPDHVHVERSITIDASAADMAPFAEDLRKVTAWSPWEGKDPNLTQTWSDSTTGVGAWYAWDGNEDVGSGKQTITSIEPGKVVHRLEFFEPFSGLADATIMYAMGDKALDVTWAYDQEADFGTKAMTVFMDMDDMLGPDFEKGLAQLAPLVAAAAAARIEAEQTAAAEEAARAEAEGEEPVTTP